jgi:dihydroxyacetone kinase-like protein
LGDDEVEFGVGIHGEPGIARQKLRTSSELAEDMCGRLIRELDVREGSEIVVMVNGLGATPLMELYIHYADVSAYLTERSIRIEKAYVGNYMTALDMAGFSVTMLRLDDELKPLLFAPAHTPSKAFNQ